MSYRYSLDRSSKKFLCPSCEKRRFVRYVDNETGEYLNDEVGHCDRANNCDYHFPPKAYFESLGGADSYQLKIITKKTKPIKPKIKFDRIPSEQVEKTLYPEDYEKNDFTVFLDAIFGEDLTNHLIEKFMIGTYERWGRSSPVFWQIDEKWEVRTGKIMAYDSDTGSRLKKEDQNYISWFHSELKYKGVLTDFNLQQCLFGAHQLNTEPADKPIGIVESEKTAIIMTALMPDFIWMASGGLSQIKKEIFMPLFGREIRLFPDLNGFEKWEEKKEILLDAGFDISINDFLEKNTSIEEKKEGFDLVDFFLIRDSFFSWALTEKKYPLFWDFFFSFLVFMCGLCLICPFQG